MSGFRDQKLREAAARAGEHQAEFCEYVANHSTADASFFLKLLLARNASLAQAIVLFDAVQHAVRHGLQSCQQMSGGDYVRRYGADQCSLRSFKRAVSDLVCEGFLDEVPQVRNVTRKFFLLWPPVGAALARCAQSRLPGLQEVDGEHV